MRVVGDREVERERERGSILDKAEFFEIGTSEALLVLYRIRSTVLGSLRLRVGSN